MIQCSCPECGHRYKIAEELIDKSVLCPECSAQFTPRWHLQAIKPKGIPQARKRRDKEDYDSENDRPRRGPSQARRQGFPLWTLAVIIPAGVFFCCGGIGFLAFLGGGLGGGRSDVPPSDPAEVSDYMAMAGEGRAAAGVSIPMKTFTIECKLGRDPYVARHIDLLTVDMKMGSRMGPQGVVFDRAAAYVERNSSAGRSIMNLLGDGGWHLITIELGTPQRRIGEDGIVEVVRAWKYDGK